jgi:hypothetical protein
MPVTSTCQLHPNGAPMTKVGVPEDLIVNQNQARTGENGGGGFGSLTDVPFRGTSIFKIEVGSCVTPPFGAAINFLASCDNGIPDLPSSSTPAKYQPMSIAQNSKRSGNRSLGGGAINVGTALQPSFELEERPTFPNSRQTKALFGSTVVCALRAPSFSRVHSPTLSNPRSTTTACTIAGTSNSTLTAQE